MSIKVVTTKSKTEELARYLLLFVLVSSFFAPGIIYVTDDNPSGYTDVAFYKDVGALRKMVILLFVATAFLLCRQPKIAWAVIAPFIPFWIWLLISAVYNGPSLRMVRSFATLLTPY